MLKPRHRPDSTEMVTINIDGRPFPVSADITVAAAMMSVKPGPTRTTPSKKEPRAPYCLMGICFDCLMKIDGKANQRACQTIVEDGMCIQRQHDNRTV